MNGETLDVYFPIIQRQYPDVKKTDVKSLSGGYSHTVFKVYDQVIRFPKTEEGKLNLRVEEAFSKRFSEISPVTIPVIHNHTDKVSGISFQTYGFVSGIPFTKEVAATLEENELITIAELIGKFLGQLHAVPIDEVRSLLINPVDTVEEYAGYFVNIIVEDKKVINSLLTKSEWEWIDKNATSYYGLVRKHPFPLKVTHADLLPKHILIDAKTHQLTGIIDFSVKLADPAHDFRYFDRYPDVFLKTVYDNYPFKDDFFDERRKFHARDLLVGYLYLALQAKEQKNEKMYIKELQEYIAKNP